MKPAATQRMTQAQAFKAFPAIPESLMQLGNAINQEGVDARLQHLIDIRVSQLNGCAFCLNMHHQEARKDGESQQRLDVISTWREVPWFSASEQAALAWAEALTDLSAGHPGDALYEELSRHFTTQQILAITATVIKINSANRFVAAIHLTPERHTS